MTTQRRFSPQTLLAVAEAISGTSYKRDVVNPCRYRSGGNIVRFFREAGYEADFRNASRLPWTEERVISIHKQADGPRRVCTLIDRLLDPRDYVDTPEKLPDVVRFLNQYLSLDGYDIRHDGRQHRVFAMAATTPIADSLQEAVPTLGSAVVQETWEKMLGRLASDPEGAITAARKLVEDTCRHLLDDLGKPSDYRGDLGKLYKATTEAMNLSADQHDDPGVRQILGGCSAVVGGLAPLSNEGGDRHGKARKRWKPEARHARLAVNMAGTLAAFLIETYEARRVRVKGAASGTGTT